MKNGYTPREWAHSIAIEALRAAFYNYDGSLDGLPPGEVTQARAAIYKLHDRLLAAAKLDALGLDFKQHIEIN